MTIAQLPVLIAGAGPVGCFIAYRLGKAGIPVQIFEKETSLPYSPRAVGYYGATQNVFQESGLYDLIRAEGFMTAGLCWRQPPVPNNQGGKSLGRMIAKQPLCAPDDTIRACPAGLLNLRQSELTTLLLREALNTGNVSVMFDREVTSIEEKDGRVIISFNNNSDSDSLKAVGSYLVGADGGKSRVRKIIGTPCLGHTWPERLISTDVFLLNEVDPVYHTCYIMGLKNYTVMTPLTEPVVGKRSLWRCTIAIPPEDERSDEEISQDKTIQDLYEQVVAGPRPLNADISAKTVYRIHQRLVTTMRKGRCVLAGDAAHMNNPYGAMGLNTGLLDGDALAEALIMVLTEGKSDELLTIYSDERRQVFQTFVDPTTTANKLRLHSPNAEAAAQDDYYFRAMQNPSAETLAEAAKPYFETWRTDMSLDKAQRGMTEPASEIPHLAHVFKNRVEYVKQSSNMAVILHHPLLGRIRGIINNNVSEYLGIKYATLADHFAPPLPLKAPNPQPGDILDATSYGPTVTAPDECNAEFGLIQHHLPQAHFEQSITEGLSLNIVVPRAQDTPPSSLPVLVFFHGGGLATGSANWPQNHISNLVSLSSELGLPTVGVSVNYRVGPAGFLTSQELRDAGFKPNNGLRDQRVALEWIQQNIHGFGGDPESITLAGHSAGGASACYHLASEKPLFKRLACLSGQFLAVQPLPRAVHDHIYSETIRMLNLDKVTSEERVSQLRELTPEALAKISVFPSRPFVDQEICFMAPSYKCIEGGIPASLHPGWCEDIFIGDCEYDGTILATALEHRKLNIGHAFASFISKELSDVPQEAARLLSSYGIDMAGQDDEQMLRNILKLANDLFFYAPTVCLARAWKTGAAYVYRFDQGNPWQGRWQGEASHITDLTVLLQNYNDHLPEEHRAVGRKYAEDLLIFASGRAPWDALKGNEDSFVQHYGSSPRGRRGDIWSFFDRIGADRLLAVFEAFVARG